MRLKFIPPLMPTLVEQPPEGDDWIHEVNSTATALSSLSMKTAPGYLHAQRPRLDDEV
jgi:hypothetical protein